MITRLLPEQISNKWKVIKYAIKGSMPPTIKGVKRKDLLNNALNSLLEEDMHCWVLHDGNTVYAIATTTFTYDKCTGVKSLLIYSLYGFKNVPSGLWQEGMNAIKKFAESKRCDIISAFTDNKRVLQIVDELGGDTSNRLVKFNLK